MARLDTDQRQHPRQIRMTDADHRRAVADAKAHSMRFSEYVRHLIAKERERQRR